MIYPDDAKEFSVMLDVTWQSLGRNAIDKTTKQYWFSKLQHLPMSQVTNFFDKWLMTEKELPTVNDIMHMSKPKDFYKALPAPKNEEVAQDGLIKIERLVSENLQTKTDYKAWAKKIIANPKNYPEISLKYAKEALK